MSRRPPSIYIVGAPSTGKSTLVDDLQKHFNASVIPGVDAPAVVTEVARTVLKQHNFTRDDILASFDACLSLQQLILAAQGEAEEAALRQAPWFVSDRSGIDPIVYASRYAGPGAPESLLQSADWSILRARMANSVIVVCEAGVKFLVDDGVRLMPQDAEDWYLMHEAFCKILSEQGLPYYVLPNNLFEREERLLLVHSRWEEARQRPMPVVDIEAKM
ncbi:hypothetical protein GQ53DRAFT_712041 [Thozetella sp. PMI_491]|nr:hypothetical protein GQ53DRAFT_712041 [Thozetella sp. PMI_491]